jgi:phosphoribosyl 1,2-cyclic phosphodiesterase
MNRLRFATLGSGSRGNATVVACGRTVVLMDCGFAVNETLRRLGALGLSGEDLSAIVVTHEHGDHMGGVARLARRFKLPVWLTAGTYRGGGAPTLPDVRLFNPHEGFAIGDVAIQPYPVPHDAREPCQFVFSDGDQRLGVLSDAGHVTPHMRRCLDGLDALILEFNHDPQLLAAGPYPPELQARVGGQLGHLNNHQAVELLAGIERQTLQHLIAGHISEKNNTPAHVRRTVASRLPAEAAGMTLAPQDEGLGWHELKRHG